MADIETEIVEGVQYRESADGRELVERVRVYNLTGLTATKIWSARSALPSRGSLHGTLFPLRLDEVRLAEVHPSEAHFDLVYGSPNSNNLAVTDDPIIEIGGMLERTVTDEDREGNKLTIAYAGSIDIPEHDVLAEIDIVRAFIRFTRREQITASQLLAKIEEYVGTTNAGTFAGFPANNLLMGPIIGRSDDGGESYVVSYELFRDKKAWKARVQAVYDNGVLPTGRSIGNGEEEYDIYPEKNFSALGL